MRIFLVLLLLFLASCSSEPEVRYVERKADGTLAPVDPPKPAAPPKIYTSVPLSYGVFRGCGWSQGSHSSDPGIAICAFEATDGSIRFVRLKGDRNFGDITTEGLSRVVIQRTDG